MSTETTATPARTFRQFAVGATVYIVDENFNILAGTVTLVHIAPNGYPHTSVSFPTPLRFAGECEWGINNLRTLDEAKALVTEHKCLSAWLSR